MTQNHLYLYCPEIKRGTSGASCRAVLLCPYPFEELDVDSFQALLLDNRTAVPVRCRVGITEIASGQDEHGVPLTFFDGEGHRPDLVADAISAAQNEVILHLDGNTLSISGPALLSTDESVTFGRLTVVLELLCTTLAELPDFAANLAHLRAFEESLQDRSVPRPSVSYAEELQAQGYKTRLGAGFVLPVEYVSGSSTHIGAIVLESRVSISPVRFSGHLYLFNRTCGPVAGTLLTRRVELGNGANHPVQFCPVARIESVAG